MIDLETYTDKIAESGRRVIRKAYEEARARDHFQLVAEHVLFAIAEVARPEFDEMALSRGLQPRRIIQAIETRFNSSEFPIDALRRTTTVGDSLRHLLRTALETAHKNGRRLIECPDLLVSGFVNLYRLFPKVFIGHGRSHIWRDLKDFLQDRLLLDYDEFNREPSAGKSIKERLSEMLENASFAFLVLSAEDEHADKSEHARENVIHEVGLFQGKLGFERAIILLEEGCSEFSNIEGLVQIRFPRGKISAIFEEIRRVLERECIITR